MLSQLITGGGVEDRLAAALKTKTPASLTLDGQTQSITIEAVRDFQKSLSLSLGVGESVSHFLLEAQNLTLPAQHALLKTLEEPQTNLQLILTADKPSSLLPTLLSRCQLTQLPPGPDELDQPTTDTLRHLLQQIRRSNPGQLLDIADSLVKSNPQPTLTNLLRLLRRSLRQKPNLQRARAAALTQASLNDLKANLQPQLALEHYLIDLKALMF